MRRTDVSIQAPSFSKRSRKVLTWARAARPPGLQAKFPHRHIGDRRHQSAELVGQEARATGAVDLQAQLEFLQTIFGIAPGAIHPLVDVFRRRLQAGDEKPWVVLRLPAEMRGHPGPDDNPAPMGPTPGPASELAIAAGRCVPGFEIGTHLCHQRFGKALQCRVLRHTHHILQSLHLIVEGQESGQRQITRGVVEAVEERQLLAAMGRVDRRVQIDGDPPNPLLAPSVRAITGSPANRAALLPSA